MADENEEPDQKIDSNNDAEDNAAEENETQPNTEIEEPKEEAPEGSPEEPPVESTEPAPNEEQEQQGEPTPEVEQNVGTEENVEAADAVPEMSEPKLLQSTERVIDKSDSMMKVPKKSQEMRSSPDIAGRPTKEAFSSRAKIVVGDVIDIRRSSIAGDVYDRKPIKYMNSYVLQSENPFNPEKVIKIVKAALEEALTNLPYDPYSCVKQAKWASSAIRTRVRQLNFDRYKIVSVVTIGEKHSQDFYNTCRFLWDAEKDRYTSYVLENTHVFGIALCFGMYYE